MPRKPGTAFRARGAVAQAGRTTIAYLPAGDLHVMLIGGSWSGAAVVTAVADRTVEVHVPIRMGRER
jgi:hypothetical protein